MGGFGAVGGAAITAGSTDLAVEWEFVYINVKFL